MTDLELNSSTLAINTGAAILSFNNSALQSWIPASVLGVLLVFGGAGVMLFFGGVQLWYLSVTMSVFGATLLLRASKETYTFDSSTKTFFMVKKRLFRTKVVELNFREIKDVKLDESVDAQGSEAHLWRLFENY
eukprot:TRINITY_DN1982_c0_g1_i2.p2 TRINITY_DN1982_c0_g1~~TRINITY_DN1982_c0_g1_i2.p2  ORF type:complete len:141 (-),score=20.00 TRINITY_DN1982_c0_g1_i2:1440-1841(-)